VSHYDSVLINRLRIGHFRLTRSYLLCGDDPPTCQSCGLLLTVKHILVECTNLRDIREKYFVVSSVRDLFISVDNHTMVNFIKETNFSLPTIMFVTHFYVSSIALVLHKFYHLLAAI